MKLEDYPYQGDITVIKRLNKPLPVFIRFGHFQSETGEPSINWATGEYENGICVVPAEIVDGKVTPHKDWIEYLGDSWDIFSERTAYVLTGRLSTVGMVQGQRESRCCSPAVSL